MKKKIYISGKITGIEKEAPALFLTGVQEMEVKGYEAVNPYTLHDDNHEKTWESYMKEDIIALCGCDAIYMLRNWRDSKGAIVELYIAQQLSLNVIFQPNI